MAKSLGEYAEWLDDRGLIWPKPPEIIPANATPFVEPLKGIRAVAWSVYGTLLRISEGELLLEHSDPLRLQVAFEKTIHEFSMWQSMHRKPGAPWKQLWEQYQPFVDEQRMADTKKTGDFPEVDVSRVWRKLLRRLGEKDYTYDLSFYGDPDEFSDKVAYFFHANLQGVAANPHALETLKAVADAGIVQALLGNGQSFTLVQLLRGLQGQGTLPPPGRIFAFDCLTLSFLEGLRTPSKSLYQKSLERFEEKGIAPGEVLYVGCRLADDLAIAKQAGMRTALYASDRTSLRATKEEMRNSELRPDRLFTDLEQLGEVLSLR